MRTTLLSEDLAVGEHCGFVVAARRSPAGDLWYAQVVTPSGLVLAYEGQHESAARAASDAVRRIEDGLKRLDDALRTEIAHIVRRGGRT